jgi:SAM-dependent methyltransferase
MPACSECRMLVDDECASFKVAEKTLGRIMPPPPIGGCAIPIVEDYLPMIKPGMRVLEVGCGAWGMIREHCEKVGAHFDGIDPFKEYFGKESVATRFENLAELSFPDEYFDIVIGNQTMEHWAEHGCTLEWGLYQCFRVCKPGGLVLMNVPIHYHGTEFFLLGKLDKIKDLFRPFSSHVEFHTWGFSSDPIPQYFPYPGYGKLKDKAAYNLDIHAVKTNILPTNFTNRGAAKGWVSRLKNNPPSYVFYRLLRRIGFAN